jgi:hypothetical protein
MAQAKAQTRSSRQRKSGSRSQRSGSSNSAARSGNSASARRSGASRARASAQSSNGRGATRARSRATPRSRPARKPTRSSAKATSSPVGKVADAAQKAKAPLIAGGVTVVGVAGAAVGLALRSSSRRKVLGIPVSRRSGLKLPGRSGGPKRDARKLASAVNDAAKRADHFGQRVSSIANTVQQVSETAEGAAKKA